MPRPTTVEQRGDATSRAISSEPPSQREHHEAETIRPTPRREPGVGRPASAADARPGPGRSGRCCPASARAAPRRPGATAGPPRRVRAGPARTRARARRPPRAAGPRRGRAPPARPPGRRRRAGGSGPGALPRGSRLEPGRACLEVGVGRQDQPQAGVQDDAEAAERRGEHERGAHPEHRAAQVAGQAGGDAAEDRLLGVAVARRTSRAARGAVPGVCCSSWVNRHTAQRARTMRGNPGATLSASPSADSGRIRVVPDGADRSADRRLGA